MSTKRNSDPHYYDCPKCGPSQKVSPIDTDRYGRQLFECGKCGRKVTESGLKLEARERFIKN
jgi:uncharacterized Zn finger protein